MAESMRDGASAVPAGAGKLKVFVSYSRDDLDFADQLVAALEACGFDPTIDRHGISGGEAWQQRLGALILEADTVVFVLSPASARSSICGWEVEEAARLGKRILPVLARALEGTSPPPRLQDLNYIFFYPEPKAPGSGFGTGLTGLAAALNTDLGWIREHTRLLERATEWDAGGRPPSRLLSGSDIAQAKAWAARRPKGAPEPTAVHLDFIRASEDEEASRASSERKRLEDMAAAQDERARALRAAEEAMRNAAAAERARARARKLIAWGSAGFSLLLLVALVGAVSQWIEADRQRLEARDRLREARITQSRSLADAAQRQADAGDASTSILLALEALPDAAQEPDRPLVFAAKERLSAGLALLRERLLLEGDAAISPDGTRVLTIPWDKKAPRLLDTATGKALFVLGPPDQPVRSAAFSPDGALVLTAYDNAAPRLWSTATGKDLFTLGRPDDAGSFASFSPDGTFAVTRLAGKAPQLWRSADGTPLPPLGGAEDTVHDVLFSPDGKLVLTLPKDQAPRLWDSATGNERLPLDGAARDITDASFSPDSKFILSKSHNWDLRLWDAATGKPVRALSAPRDRFFSHGVFSPDGKFVLTRPREQAPRLWDISAEAAGQPRVLGDDPVEEALFSPDGTLVLTLASGTPLLWDASSGELRFRLGDGPVAGRTAAFTPDGKFVLTLSTDGKLKLWNTETRAEEVLDEGARNVTRVAFSPDGRHLLTISDDETTTVRLWSVNGAERFAFAAHRHRPDRIVLSRDGRVALTVSRTDVTRVWDLGERSEPDRGPALQALIDHAKAAVPRCLTIEQRRTFLLRPEPPRWCIAMARQPYESPAWTTKDAVDEAIAKELGTFADTALKAGDFSKALEAIDLAMKFGPGVAWLKVNRIHALMFLDRVSEARAAYLAHRGTALEGLGAWEKVVLDDFAALRENGRQHALMDEIEKLFRTPPGVR